MVTICALASGSNGNCYYIGHQDEAILVDAGINCKQILARLKSRRLSTSKIRAVFITHEHRDHVCGARVLSKKLDIPVYMSKGTHDSLYFIHRPLASRIFNGYEPISAGKFIVYPVPKNHDATEPTSFRVLVDELNIGVFTDIGKPCANVISHLEKCDALFLETNYDEKMLWEGSYPYPLKQRVASDVGHLSNKQAVDLIENSAGPHLKWILLSHLSAQNNTPVIATNAMKHLEGRYHIKLTSRYEAGEVISL